MYSSKIKFTKTLKLGSYQETRKKMRKQTDRLSIVSLDRLRSKLLKAALSNPFTRTLYSHRHLRLAVTYFFTCLLCVPLSLMRPDLLLLIGPLIYGYIHLFSSYFYCLKRGSHSTLFRFKLFSGLTLFFILSKLIGAQLLFPDHLLPLGAMELILISFGFFIIVIKEKRLNLKTLGILIGLNSLILPYAWNNPLKFVSLTLFTHNWIAFFFWIKKARDKENLLTALAALSFFMIFNALVLTGSLDFFFVANLTHENLQTNSQATSWLLNPWTTDGIDGQRALCLYTLGLSLHYFIWLKAIPESDQSTQTPPSFRLSVKKLEKDLSKPTLLLVVLTIAAGFALWFYNYELGSYLYFLFASLHFWLEILGFSLQDTKIKEMRRDAP